MDDLISRRAAIDAFKKELTVGESKGNYVTICSAVGYEGARQILESLPSAQHDVVEVVRCRECKWWSGDEHREWDEYLECTNPNWGTGIEDRYYISPPGFYCGWGEDYCVTWSYIKRQMNKKLNDDTSVAMCEIERAMNEAWSIFVGERTKELLKKEKEQ